MTPGWYGKLPSLGDFASRRLPADFVAAWDLWLQQCMRQSQKQLGERWLDAYLTAPIWRFLIGPGTFGHELWCGILLPSVDRVGRYFPLTLCCPTGALLPVTLEAMDEWFATLEQAAYAGLDASISCEQFDRMVQSAVLTSAPRLDIPVDEIAKALAERAQIKYLEHVSAISCLSAASSRLLERQLSGLSLWINASAGSSKSFLCHGMPDPNTFSGMLDYSVPG